MPLPTGTHCMKRRLPHRQLCGLRVHELAELLEYRARHRGRGVPLERGKPWIRPIVTVSRQAIERYRDVVDTCGGRCSIGEGHEFTGIRLSHHVAHGT